MILKLISIFLLFIMVSCGIFKYEKPKEIFYCKINGEVFRPEGEKYIGAKSPMTVRYNPDKKVLTIDCINKSKYLGLSILIDTLYIFPKKIIFIKGDFFLSGIYNPINDTRNSKNFYSEEGEFIITSRNEKGINGTFNFICIDPDTKKEYKITDGEFNDLVTQ